MSVQVSNKKQIILFLIFIFIILTIVEISIKIITINEYESCNFIENDVYKNFEKKTLIEMCKNYDEVRNEYNEYLSYIPNQTFEHVSINNVGLRGNEIIMPKPENTYRIFLVGGSTMFGSGSSSDETTIPGYLQKKVDSVNYPFDVEIINAGLPGAYSKTEVLLVNDIISNLEPNLIIIYDGWNDAHIAYSSHIDNRGVKGALYDLVNQMKKEMPFYKTPLFVRNNVMSIFSTTTSENNVVIDDLEKKTTLWKERWDNICKKYDSNFDIIITVQPMLGSGKKIFSNSEKTISNSTGYPISQAYAMENFVNTFSEFRHCESLVDMKNSFDQYNETIFFDRGHVGDNGNHIISEKFFELISKKLDDFHS